MENLWAPWRMAFIEPKTPTAPGCIFCTQPAANEDEKYHILYRGERCFMMLNLYPYNNGHLMIAPYEHCGALQELPLETLTELMAQSQWAIKAIKHAMNPDGFNMGFNQGKVAGAGFAEHIHFHIVPRWNGDTNFMPVLADIKVMPEHLDTVYQKLLAALEATKTAPGH
ncbi:HIT family protein [Tengunoibacter tsumagoiensis]|uniref:Hydrolase n=1 Tax=Tengunoibacter tsumagoiensis TaxID=2014871 RepID=A0A401ZW08_9CHLR|nr:HIT domain-containing protein [Tengunoibacter tsumagoiensis]GCE11091.1 hydrolase [Tengunoibacter tsumagoiensis]